MRNHFLTKPLADTFHAMDATVKANTEPLNNSPRATSIPRMLTSGVGISSTAKRALDGLALPKRLAALGLPAITAALGLYAETPSNPPREQDGRTGSSASTGAIQPKTYSQPSVSPASSAPLTTEIETTRREIQEERKQVEVLKQLVALLKAESERRKKESEKSKSEPIAQENSSPKKSEGSSSSSPASTTTLNAAPTPQALVVPQAAAAPQPAQQHNTPVTSTNSPRTQTTQAPSTPIAVQPAATLAAQQTPQLTQPTPAAPIYTPISSAPPNAYYKYQVLDDATIRKHLARGATMPSSTPTYTAPQQQPTYSASTVPQAMLVSLSQIQSFPGHVQNVVTISSLPNFLNGQMIINRILDRCQQGRLNGIAYLYNIEQAPSPYVQVHLLSGFAPEKVRDAIIKNVLQEQWYPGGR